MTRDDLVYRLTKALEMVDRAGFCEFCDEPMIPCEADPRAVAESLIDALEHAGLRIVADA